MLLPSSGLNLDYHVSDFNLENGGINVGVHNRKYANPNNYRHENIKTFINFLCSVTNQVAGHR
jgi:hypothetical protein